MFVTSADFTLEPYSIPNKGRLGTSLTKKIEQLEEELLTWLLGLELYEEMVEAYEALPNAYSSTTALNANDEVVYGNSVFKAVQNLASPVPVPDAGDVANWELVEETNKWLELVNGGKYRLPSDLKLYKWKGFKELLKPYVYAIYVKENFDSFTGMATTEPQTENSIPVTSAQRFMNAWNEANRLAGGGSTVYYLDNTLYGFIHTRNEEAADTYPNWDYSAIESVNALDL